MTRSIFDPTGGEMASEGDAFMPGRADNLSHVPPELVDGKVAEETADAQVPLKGEAGDDALSDDETLSEAETRAMAQAAEAAKVKAANADQAPKAEAPGKAQKDAQNEDQDDVRWLQDI